MKTISRFILMLVSLAAMTACEKDGDKIYLSSLQESDLIATESEVLLTQENSKQVVLSLAWTRSSLMVSNPDMQAPNVLSTTLQVSTVSDFAANVVESSESALSKAYTGADLNTVAKNLSLMPDVPTLVYFRLKSTTGNNITPVYSSVATVTITSYLIDMTVGFVLDKDMVDNGLRLYSPQASGEYIGFMGAAGWSNFFLKESDGTVWGNVNGDAFLLSSSEEADERWNLWFPGIGGCYYVDVNTNKKNWSALAIPALTASGDIEGEMTFDRANVKWALSFTTTKAGNFTVKISGTGKQYDYATGTDDAAAKDTPVGFAVNGEILTFGQQAEDISIHVPEAGDYTLTIDLSNPRNWTVKAIAGTEGPAEVRQEIFLSGIDHLISGEWNFNNKLRLYDEDGQAYAGVAYAATTDGYSIYLEADNWDDKYTFATGNASAGTMAFKGAGGNFPAPAEGLYFFDTSLKALTYSLTAIGSEIYYSGVNDNWDFHALQATATKGVYTGSITIEKASEWGFKLYLLNGNWDLVYGGSNGAIYYKGNGITDDATLAPGTYTLTVDLIKGTYSIK